MTIGNWMRVIAVASLVGAGAATPAWSNGNRAALQSSDRVTPLQNSDRVAVQSWANDAAAQSGGVIREDAFLNEMGRRWDADPNHTGTRGLYLNGMRARWEAIDPDNRGLTPAQISELTGNVDSRGLPTGSGADVQAGNMGPGNMKAQ